MAPARTSLQNKFQEELTCLHQLGRAFSRDNPQLTRFLGDDASDPDVERLLEGFAFLSARLRLKIEDDFPELTHSMLQLLWPNYLRPLPSITVVRFDPTGDEIGHDCRIPKGAGLLSKPVDGIPCEFRTCSDVAILPLVIGNVSDAHSREKSILRIDLASIHSVALHTLQCDDLTFYLSGDTVTAQTIRLWLSQYLDAIIIEIDGQTRRLATENISFPGFNPEESLLPYPGNALDSYRILQEYFIFPQRFYFFTLNRLGSFWSSAISNNARLEFHFSRPMPTGISVHTGDFSLHCTAAVNLFAWDAEPVTLTGQRIEQQILPSGHQPDAYEIFSIDSVTGFDDRKGDVRVFHAFESLQHEIESAEGRDALYYRARIANAANGNGLAHAISFVRSDETSYICDTEVISLALTCTNRDLPLALNRGDILQFCETTPGPVRPYNLTSPTPSYRPVLDGTLQRNLIANLSLNYLSLLSPEPLRAVLRSYDFAALHDLQRARATNKRLAGILDVQTQPVDRMIKRLPIRGLKTVITLDETAFLCEGDLHLFGCVLNHFFSLYARINSFHALEIINTRNNEHYEWPQQTGNQPMF